MRRLRLLLAACFAVCAADIPRADPKNFALWSEPKRTSGPRDLTNEMDILRLDDATSLHNLRMLCMNGLGAKLRNRQLARGNDFPEVHSFCRAAEEASIRYRSWYRLFASLVLQDRYGLTSAESAEELDRAKPGEISKLMLAVVDAAEAGIATFTGDSGRAYPYRPELAYMTGLSYGMINPDRVMPIPDAIELEVAARGCFASNPLNTITLNNEAMPSRRACLFVGALMGQRLVQNPRAGRG